MPKVQFKKLSRASDFAVLKFDGNEQAIVHGDGIWDMDSDFSMRVMRGDCEEIECHLVTDLKSGLQALKHELEEANMEDSTLYKEVSGALANTEDDAE